jgi:hypothetical protein
MKSEKDVVAMKTKLREWGKTLIPADFDKFDWEAEIDGSLSVAENKREIKEKLVKLGLYKDEKVIMAQAKSQEMQMVYETNLAALKQIEEYNLKLTAQPVSGDLLQFYMPIYRAVRKLKCGFARLLCIKGIGGIGKTYNTRNALLEEPKADFVEIRGDVTPAYLYRILFDNREKILYFNDVNRLLKHPESINMLKAATETDGERVLSKLSYSKDQEDLPPRFIYNGSIIFDYNFIEPSVQEDFDALLSRADYIELNFSIDDIKQIMRLVAKEEWQQDVTEFLIGDYEYTGQNLLNLRTQVKAFNTYKYAKEKGLAWEQEIKQEQANSMSKIRGSYIH